jgi:hypothetical protein
LRGQGPSLLKNSSMVDRVVNRARSEKQQHALARTYTRDRLKLVVLYRCWSLLSAPADRGLQRHTWFKCCNPRCYVLSSSPFLGYAYLAPTGSIRTRDSLGIDNPTTTPGFETANMSMSRRPIKPVQVSMASKTSLIARTLYLSRRIGDVPPGFVNFGQVNEPGRTP